MSASPTHHRHHCGAPQVPHIHKKINKSVTWGDDVVHTYVDQPVGGDNHDDQCFTKKSVLTTLNTTEISILSSLHGRQRRELRHIEKRDLQEALKYGKCTPAYPCRRTYMPRWKFEYRDVIYITDYDKSKEITSYRVPVAISKAPISVEILKRHDFLKQLITEDPKLCSTHTFVICDQSGSMKRGDVNGFRSRSHAAHGLLALDFVANQISERSRSDNFIEALTLISMKDTGTVVFEKQPLDWLTFNKVVDLQDLSKPSTHGSYSQSLKIVAQMISKEVEALTEEIDTEDLPIFTVILISDGRPSDRTLGQHGDAETQVREMGSKLGSKLVFQAMGLGDEEKEFDSLKKIVQVAKDCGASGSFTHTGLSASLMSTTMSSFSETLTVTRTELLSKEKEISSPKVKKFIEVIPLRSRQIDRQEMNNTSCHWPVDRIKYDHRNRHRYPWPNEKFESAECIGIEIDVHPFAKGAERLVYRFSEINNDRKRVGKVRVAKDSVFTSTLKGELDE
eukprot:GHVN01096268.1.p1 GENE.GHVN01096268.1~~GHVN01096268.1.p1  ORF type:complete len:521 (+),score=71.97 GHVN01096268.1:40-1563(+)